MKFLSLIAISAILFSGCGFGGKPVNGNGTISSEEKTISAFKDVETGGNFEVYISQGELKPMKIEGDQNLLEYVEVEQTGDKLEIRTRDGYNLKSDKGIKIFLTAPVYKSIRVSGAGNIIGQGKLVNDADLKISVSGAGDITMDVDAPSIESSVSGSGNINMKGETRDFKVRISGAGEAHCYDMKAENTDVHISGAGSADVFASVKLEAHVSGAGKISYKGSPKTVNQQVSGAGSVNKAGD
ncbi:MAG: head GIN domain-containing protein [Chitinophagaceae bacterium]